MTTREAFTLAHQHHRAGRLAEADGLYRQILAVQPNHVEALHHLGVIAHQVGRHDLAVEWIRKALVLNPNDAAAQSNLGAALSGQGKFDEAAAAYRRALQLQPDYPEAHLNLGIALSEQGQIEEAIAAFRRAIEQRPGYVEAHYNLATILARRGQFDEAVGGYNRALELRPDYPEAHYNLALALVGQRRFEAAIVSYRRALEIKPDYAEAHANLGNALKEQGLLDDAIAAYQRALEIAPEYAEVHSNLGSAFRDRGQLDEAVAAHRRALALRPGYAAACNNLGIALKDQARHDEAVSAYLRALELQPDYPEAHSNLSYTLHLHPGYDSRMIAEERQRWNRQFSEPFKHLSLPHPNDRDPERRLRIGYVSADFRDHVAGRNLAPLFHCHDHEGFEILCYSGVTKPDSLTDNFRRRADHWRSTVGVSDAVLADTIRRDGADILVDLALHTAGNRLPMFARLPAPVQASFAGYPESTGLEAIGYRISDRYLEAGMKRPTANVAAEQVFLIESFWCYDPCGLDVEVNELPAQARGAITFGCLNDFAKINEPVLTLWARVLGMVSDSRLVLLGSVGGHRKRALEILESSGVDARRVEFFTPRARPAYLELYHHVDIVLDPFPYNGHTTSLEALWMGVPVVSLAGEQSVSRAGWSQLSNLGLAELAAFSADDYVRIAASLARDLPRLMELRRTLRPRMQASTLMNASRFTRGIETAYRTMWQQWCVQKQA